MAQQRLLRVISALAVLASAQVEHEADERAISSSLAADDECHASGSSDGQPGCGLNALQARAQKHRGGEAVRTEAVGSRAVCHTVQKGSACWNQTNYAFGTGIYAHPEWYSDVSLTKDSSFEEFQAAMHRQNKTLCPFLPCSCYTARKDEPCFEKATWAKFTGIYENPKWYAGLTSFSSLDDFQRKVHEEEPSLCPEPCKADTCHTAAEGEPCHKTVSWIVSQGLYSHPEWYSGLSAESTFEEVQAHVHKTKPDSCPAPCNDWRQLH